MKKKILFFLVTVLVFNHSYIHSEEWKIIRKHLKSKLEYVGDIAAENKVTLRSKSGGELIDVYIKEGCRVLKDSPVIALDCRIEKLQYDESMISIETAKSNKIKTELSYNKIFEGPDKNEINRGLISINEAKLNHSNAVRQLELNASLFQQNAITSEQKKQSENNVKLAEEALKKTEASYQLILKPVSEWDKKLLEQDKINAELQLKKSEIASDLKKINLENKTLYAPFAGTVTNVFIRNGELISQGAPICELLDENDLSAEFYVSPEDVFSVYYGQKIKIICDAISEKSFNGEIHFISNEVKLPDRTLRVKARLTDCGGFLKPGMFGRILIQTEQNAEALLIPDKSVFYNKSVPFVKLKIDDKIVETPITIIRSFNGFHQIKGNKIQQNLLIEY